MSLQTITHLLAAGSAALLVWIFQAAVWGERLAEARLEATTYQLKVSAATIEGKVRLRQAEQSFNTRYQEALNEARTHESLLQAELDRLGVVSDGLRTQAADAARRLAGAPPAAILEYATALNVVHDDCRAAYAGMAAKAAGHAADVQTLRDAWPVIPPPSKGKQ